MKERSLLAFTLLAQLAVGAFVTVGALGLWAGITEGEPTVLLFVDGALLWVALAMALAMLASAFHLGAPASALHAVRNLRTSWLSREVLLMVSFTVLVGLLSILRRSGAGSSALLAGVAAAAGTCGLGLVYAMARVYRIRTVPRWDTVRTTASFFVTMLLLGPLAVAAGLALGPDLTQAAARAPLLAIALVAAGGFSAEIALGGRGVLHTVRGAILFAGLVLCALSLLAAGRSGAFLAAAFAAALAAQGIGRYQFYVVGPGRPL